MWIALLISSCVAIAAGLKLCKLSRKHGPIVSAGTWDAADEVRLWRAIEALSDEEMEERMAE